VNQPDAAPDPRGFVFDPRVVLLAFVSIAIWVSTTGSLAGALVWLALALILAWVCRGGGDQTPGTWPNLRWALPFAILILCLYVLMAPATNTPDWTWGPIAVDGTSLLTGGRLALRFLTFVLIAGVLPAVLTPARLAIGVTRMLWPLRMLGIAVESVYYLMFFIARMAPVLTEEARIIQFGQRSRGLKPARSWYRRLKSSASLIVPVFAAAIRRSERLALALASRGFDPGHIPEMIATPHFGNRDWLMLAGVGAGWLVWCAIRVL